MPPDSVTMVHNCLYSDSEFSPTCCPFPVSQWYDSFRPHYSGDKPYRNLTGLPEMDKPFPNYAIIPYSFIAKSYSIDKNLSISFL